MRRTLSAAAAFVALAASSPAPAQSAQELLGLYPLEVTYEGADCPEVRTLAFKVTAIRGGVIEYEIDGEDDKADYHGPSKSFRKQHMMGDEAVGAPLTGRFTRRPDSVRLDLEWRSGGCVAHMAGIRPAAPLPTAAMGPPPGAAPAPAAPSATTPAPPPAPAEPTAQAGGLLANPMIVIPIIALLLAAGGLIGFLAGRRRKPKDEG